MSSSLVVNTNLSAIQTLNDLNATDNSLTTAVNRLSSGLQISSAATGPAQYVISQALQSQANGYGAAINNAQDGVSLIQTASGALTQISSILQTMQQLALTSANSATQTTTSLKANQSEFSALVTSINEIAHTTTFGQKNLLIGTTAGSSTGSTTSPYTGQLQVGAFNLSDQQITLKITAVTAKALSLTGGAATVAGATVTNTASLKFTAKSLTITLGTTSTAKTQTATVKLTGTLTLTQVAAKINATATGIATASVVKGATGKSHIVLTSATTGTVKLATTALTSSTATAVSVFTATSGTGTSTHHVNLTSSATAKKAIAAVQTALAKVDKVASNVGATQNELQAFVSNLTVGQQNLQAASSQLVNVNMAQEMTTYSTSNILMQSGIAMLAQAQQLPSLVLKLGA